MINRLFQHLRGLLKSTRPVTTRLHAHEAVALARAADGISSPENLSMATPCLRDGQAVWIVSEAAIGNVQIVEVDDATGAVLSKYRRGVR